jgi:histone deacetylase 6
VEPREATEKEILVQHSVEQIEILKATRECKDEEFLEDLSSRYDAIYIHPVSRKLYKVASSRHDHRNNHNNLFRIHSCKGVV